MLRSISEITGYKVLATDGDIGRCKDFLFDDTHWAIRYMVAETGGWLSSRKTLISPISLDRPDWTSRRLVTRMTRQMIEAAPELDADAPVSRQYERKYHDYFGWPMYWRGMGVWAAGTYPQALFDNRAPVAVEEEEEPIGDPHLRSIDEVKGYDIAALDGTIGVVSDFILDDETWTIRYLVVDTRKWLVGRKVLVAPAWVKSVDWSRHTVQVGMTRDQVKGGPEFDPTRPVNREYEVQLFDYYGRPYYW